MVKALPGGNISVVVDRLLLLLGLSRRTLLVLLRLPSSPDVTMRQSYLHAVEERSAGVQSRGGRQCGVCLGKCVVGCAAM